MLNDPEFLALVIEAERQDRENGITSYRIEPDPGAWLDGIAADPSAVPAEPVDTILGWPFLVPGISALIYGPTGGGRSSLVQACAYDAAYEGVPTAYMGFEVSIEEFNARTAKLADIRGHDYAKLDLLRYLDLTDTITRAMGDPGAFIDGVAARYGVLVIDPLSAVESALSLDFESNREYLRFYDGLIEPLVKRGVAVVLLENIGHGERVRPKGASAKQDRAYLMFGCKPVPDGLLIRNDKRRGVRVPFKLHDEWLFGRESQHVDKHGDGGAPVSGWRPTILMAKVKAELGKASEPLSKRQIRTLVGGRAEYVDGALQALMADGIVVRDSTGFSLSTVSRTHPRVHGVGTRGVSTVSALVPKGVPAIADTVAKTVSPHLQSGGRDTSKDTASEGTAA